MRDGTTIQRKHSKLWEELLTVSKQLKAKIRPWSLDDVENLVKYANNPRVAANLTDGFPHPYTQEDAERFITMAMSASPTRIFAIDINGEAIGGIGLHLQEDIYRNNAELGYWLAEPFWGKGIMTKIVREAVQYGFKHFLIERIYARPFGTNMGSQRVLEKAGFVLEAHFYKTLIKNGKLEDELVFGIRKD